MTPSLAPAAALLALPLTALLASAGQAGEPLSSAPQGSQRAVETVPPEEEDNLPEIDLTLNGKRTKFSKLPESVGPWPRAALRFWAPFAEEHDLALHLTEECRVLLIQSKKQKPRKYLKLIKETVEEVDGMLPLPAREPEPESKDETKLEIDEEGNWTVDWTYEIESAPLESETAVLVQVKDDEVYAAALDRVVDANKYLEAWAPSAKELTGCILQRPLIAVWQERPDGMEEWDINNELVHRLAQLMVIRRFGQLPYWLTNGTAWTVEERIRGSIYCYPYRDGFVFAAEHGDWWPRLRNGLKQSGIEFSFDRVAAWQRGKYEELSALMAYGTAQMIFRECEPEAVSGVFEELRLFREANNRRDLGGKKWETIEGYEVPGEDQLKIFGKLAPDFEEQLEASFLKGKKYKLKD